MNRPRHAANDGSGTRGERIAAARAAALLHAAIGNEMAIDRLTSEGYGLGIVEPLPRPLRLPKILKGRRWLQTPLLRILEAAWPVIGSGLASLQAIRLRRTVSATTNPDPVETEQLIVVSNLPNQTIVTAYAGLPLKRTWLRLPGMSPGVPDGEHAVSVTQLAGRADVAWAWRMALREIWRKPRHGRGARLQTYVAVPFFLTFRVVERLASDPSRTIAFTQQLDRWSVLLDGAKGVAPRWFLQHGRLGAYMRNESGHLTLVPPAYVRRLHRVSLVACFSDRDRGTIMRYMLAHPERPRFDLNPPGAGLVLTPPTLPPGRTRSILFIGEPVRMEDQVMLVQRLAATLPGDIQILVKPHPRYPATPFTAGLSDLSNVSMLDAPGVYPKVHLVVYTISFLGDQYDSIGEPVAMVSLDDIEAAAAAVRERVQSLTSNSNTVIASAPGSPDPDIETARQLTR